MRCIELVFRFFVFVFFVYRSVAPALLMPEDVHDVYCEYFPPMSGKRCKENVMHELVHEFVHELEL